MKYKETAKVISQECIAKDTFSMWIDTKNIVKEACAGQFISIYCKDGSRLLPRPISICELDKKNGYLRVVYRVVGEGTKEFSALSSGDDIDIMGPLGNGFYKREKKAILIGGGIGVPPMLQLAKELNGTCHVQIVAGYRDEIFLKKDLEQNGDLYIATDDGNCGVKGTVIDAIEAYNLDAEVIYACGPAPMLCAVKEFAGKMGIECQISMEERMACGIGACLACVCKSKEKDSHTHVNNKRICKDGPVFFAEEVEL